MVAADAKDLISQLLNKDPSKRMGSMMGATAIKNHPFFEGVNWALLRCTKPPYVPKPFNPKDFVSANYDCCEASKGLGWAHPSEPNDLLHFLRTTIIRERKTRGFSITPNLRPRIKCSVWQLLPSMVVREAASCASVEVKVVMEVGTSGYGGSSCSLVG
ncbi:protein kinase G11A [Sesamum angolense]|uniref:non-specific serine/threonine protein kinase n=1 Tax=Sesamum angolense TaxID=2727404 RepID=A0AAE1W2H2_9LAMI|nr:protein kinase G11A [Sesamum angolense]